MTLLQLITELAELMSTAPDVPLGSQIVYRYDSEESEPVRRVYMDDGKLVIA